MATALYGDTLLVAQFREFYNEVIRLKHTVHSAAWNVRARTGEESERTAQSINSVWQRLLTLLEQQELTASRLGGDYFFEIYKESQYIMAGLADEIFLNLNWPGKEIWRNNLLESKLFNSHSAGDIFFQKLDKLLNARDPIYTDLAKVYLMALSLGFEGKHRGAEEADAINRYRLQLFEFIRKREPEMETETYRLFPDAYSHTLDQAKVKLLPHPRGWIVAVIAALAAYLAVSHVLWVESVADLKLILKEIFSIK